MSGALDAILAAVNRLVDRPVLYVAKKPGSWQLGHGPDRPVYSHRFLVLHPKDESNAANWRLPASVSEVVSEDVQVDDAGDEIDGVQIVRCAEFQPVLGDRYDGADWLPADFVVDHPWIHPIAARAADSFERAQTNSATGTPFGIGRRSLLGPGIYFDDQPSGEISMEPRSAFIDAQAKAERVAHLFGDSAPSWLNGEGLNDYRVRLLSKYQAHSRVFKAANLARIAAADAGTLAALEDQIYSDAAAAAHDPSSFRPGELRAVVTMDSANRPITKYVGDPNACWDQFNPPLRYVRRFMTPGRA